MKFGLLVSSPTETQNSKNIGDYVQSLAARQYYPHIDAYIRRECISDYHSIDNEKIKVITNAWWMWNPSKWPPSDDIIALPISMHISPYAAKEMLKKTGGADWFKRNEPIGCRDKATVNLLNSYGIKAYFSACLTLTLYRSYPPVKPSQRKGICFVDPYIPRKGGILDNIKILLHIFSSPYTIFSLSMKKFFSEGYYYNKTVRMANKLKVIRQAALFHLQYSKLFSNELLRKAEFIHHMYNVEKIKDDNKLMEFTDKLLRKYQMQKLIVTSRIHVALPSIGMETPVIFIKHPDIVGENWNANRLDGIIDFFHCMEVSYYGLRCCNNFLLSTKKITSNIILKNKNNWKKYANELETQCLRFCKD